MTAGNSLRFEGRRYEEVVELLLASNGVHVDSKNTNGRTPLSWAAGKGNYAAVKLLLTKDGIDPDSKDKDGWTPLSWAKEGTDSR
jgi:ankyrin repeat protein